MPQASPRRAPGPPPTPLSTCPSPASAAPQALLDPRGPALTLDVPVPPPGPAPTRPPFPRPAPTRLLPGVRPPSLPWDDGSSRRLAPPQAQPQTGRHVQSPQSSGDPCCSSGTGETRRQSWVSPKAERGRHRPDACWPRPPGQCCPLETPVAPVPREKGVDLCFPTGL